MDTRFWGPSGWKLLHHIAACYPVNPDENNKNIACKWLKTLPKILPCIYCRRSLTEYYKKYPIKEAIISRKSMKEWLWKIHNCVNKKLRDQGVKNPIDLPFQKLDNIYPPNNALKWGNKISFPGWRFLWSILHNLPEDNIKETLKKDEELCGRWLAHVYFLKYLPNMLPSSNFKTLYNGSVEETNIKDLLQDRELAFEWLSKLEKNINPRCRTKNNRINECVNHSSSCTGSVRRDKLPTCRARH